MFKPLSVLMMRLTLQRIIELCDVVLSKQFAEVKNDIIWQIWNSGLSVSWEKGARLCVPDVYCSYIRPATLLSNNQLLCVSCKLTLYGCQSQSIMEASSRKERKAWSFWSTRNLNLSCHYLTLQTWGWNFLCWWCSRCRWEWWQFLCYQFWSKLV